MQPQPMSSRAMTKITDRMTVDRFGRPFEAMGLMMQKEKFNEMETRLFELQLVVDEFRKRLETLVPNDDARRIVDENVALRSKNQELTHYIHKLDALGDDPRGSIAAVFQDEIDQRLAHQAALTEHEVIVPLQTTNKELEDRVMELRVQLSRVEGAALEAQIRDEELIKSLQQQIATAAEENNSLRQQIDSLKYEGEVVTAERNNLREDCEVRATENNTLRENIAALEQDTTRLHQELENLREEKEDLELQLHTAQERLDEADERITELDVENNRVHNEREELRSRLEEAEVDFNELREQHAAQMEELGQVARASNEQLTTECDGLRETIAKLEHDLAQAQEVISRIENDNSQMRAAAHSRVNELTTELSQAHERLALLTQKDADMDALIETMRRELESHTDCVNAGTHREVSEKYRRLKKFVELRDTYLTNTLHQIDELRLSAIKERRPLNPDIARQLTEWLSKLIISGSS